MILGAIIGVFSSLIAWYILFHLIKPFLIFEKIIISKLADGNEHYSAVIRNAGFTKCVDLELVVRIRIPGIAELNETILTNVDLSVDTARLVRLSPNGYRRFTFTLPMEEFTKHSFPEQVKLKAHNKSLILEDLFKINENTKITIYAFAYDSLSGSRTLQVSQDFELKHLSSDLKILSNQEFKQLTSTLTGTALRLLRRYKQPVT